MIGFPLIRICSLGEPVATLIGLERSTLMAPNPHRANNRKVLFQNMCRFIALRPTISELDEAGALPKPYQLNYMMLFCIYITYHDL